MMTFTRLVPRPLILLSRSPIGCGWRRPPAPLQGLLARAHRIRSTLLPVLVHRAEPIPAGRTAACGMAPHP